MSWERDPLWAKSKLFFENAFVCPRDEPNFGLWCAFGLELLARAAVASVSPTLLAEPDREQKHLLHALKRGSERVPRKSIGTAQVLSLCQSLFPEFTPADQQTASALINRRNDELHTGSAAFAEYTTQQWIAGFYRCCRSLCSPLGESLESLFGHDEASVANQVLTEIENEVKQRVQNQIAAYRKVFEDLDEEKRQAADDAAKDAGQKLAYQRHHRVDCPACRCTATVQGTPFGVENVTQSDGDIVVKQPVAPNSFSCSACGLKLTGYAELCAADLGDQYTRSTTYSPEEYYGLIHPEDTDMINHLVSEALANDPDIVREYIWQHEYDNE